ncbi:plasmid mobilization protein [Donghicola mangrovi]|uniref:plasmid mobilization protein n=1 Tax=Donghicola mangrovi TaxID=2729614 RepID=UPI003B832773
MAGGSSCPQFHARMTLRRTQVVRCYFCHGRSVRRREQQGSPGGPVIEAATMSHRYHRDAPTKGRRIHATDEEWSRVQSAAARAQLSVSAFVVQSTQSRKLLAPAPQRTEVIRLLTACHGLLAEIADQARFDRDTDAATIATGMTEVSALLDAVLQSALAERRADEAVSCS